MDPNSSRVVADSEDRRPRRRAGGRAGQGNRIDLGISQPYLPAEPRASPGGDHGPLPGLLPAVGSAGCYYYASERGFPRTTNGPRARTPSTARSTTIDAPHYFTTLIKFGIGRSTYDASQEVRSGDLLREEAVALVKRYDGEYPERFSDELMEYLSLPPGQFPQASQQFETPEVPIRDYFVALADRFRSPHLWEYDGEWRLRHRVADEGG